MPKYIKSHSNYRLSTKHQSVRNGTVLERDISTVGGVNSFATGQSTIYSSGNFIMTVNNTASTSGISALPDPPPGKGPWTGGRIQFPGRRSDPIIQSRYRCCGHCRKITSSLLFGKSGSSP